MESLGNCTVKLTILTFLCTYLCNIMKTKCNQLSLIQVPSITGKFMAHIVTLQLLSNISKLLPLLFMKLVHFSIRYCQIKVFKSKERLLTSNLKQLNTK